MDQADRSVREQFLATGAAWVRRLQRGGPGPAAAAAGASDLVNLSHRLADTLPTPLAERLEGFVDEFWTLCGERWGTGGDAGSEDPDELTLRIDGLSRTWGRLERDLQDDWI